MWVLGQKLLGFSRVISCGFSTLVTSPSISKVPFAARSWTRCTFCHAQHHFYPTHFRTILGEGGGAPIRLSRVAEAYELPSSESNNVRQFTPETSTTTTGYTTGWSPTCVAVIDFSTTSISQIEVWCFWSQVWQVVPLLQSATLCLAPAQLKHKRFCCSILLLSVGSTTLLHSADLWSVAQ